MVKELENILGNFKKVISPAIPHTVSKRRPKEDEELFQEIESGSIHDIPGMMSKYKKLIAMLTKTGRNSEIPHLKQQLAQLIKISKFIREQEQNQLDEHDLKIQKDNARYIQEINKELKAAKKDLEKFFAHYGEDFELLKKQLEAKLAELQKQLSTVLTQLREVKEQILDIETQIADAKEQKATVEQEINTTEIAVITILDEEWQQDKDNFPKPDFQESLHSAYDRNNPPKDSNDFLSNTLLLLREQFEQELKQKIALIVEKELKQIGAKEDKIKQERAKFDARETRIRKRMDTHPSFLTLWIGHKRILSIDSKVQKLDLQEQQLKEKEKELLKKASELTSGIQTAEKDMQEYTIRALKDSRQENTTRPRPTPFSNNHA